MEIENFEKNFRKLEQNLKNFEKIIWKFLKI